MTGTALRIFPTSRPLLPDAEAILPFLKEIDARRWYSNFGPLVRRFEAELEMRTGAGAGSVVTVANATAGMTLALRDIVGEATGLCVMPAWTFAATPIAARNAGLTPFFADVDPATWQLAPERIRDLLPRLAQKPRAIVPVAPFGAPVDVDAWAAFAEETGVPVVLDAAAAFDTMRHHPGIVSVVSLHATKVLGVGDGGFVLAGDAARGERLRRMSNFGFDPDRRSVMPGTNAKMSEYSAAIGLAALAHWPRTRARLIDAAASLAERIGERPWLVDRRPPAFASATFKVSMREPRAEALIAWLRACGLEARKWWGDGCHRHPAFADLPREDLAATDRIAARTVALPFWADMTADEQDVVASCVRRFEDRGSRGPLD